MDNPRNEPHNYVPSFDFLNVHSSPSPVEVAHPLKRAHAALGKDSKDKSMSHNGRVKTSKVKQMLGSL